MKKILALLLAVLLVAVTLDSVAAQGGMPQPPTPGNLTAQQMRNAVVVSNGSASNCSGKVGQVYRLKNCDESDPNSPCYFFDY